MVSFGADEADLKTKMAMLQNRYSEGQRRYHTFEHLQEVFGELIEHQDDIENPLLVGFADLYHDSFYDPMAVPGRNEYLSSVLGRDEVEPLYGWNLAAKVGYFITATARHEEQSENSDLSFFLDADLAILGAEPERYDRYAGDIAVENEHYPAHIYIPGRIAVLQKLSTRSLGLGIFTTEVMRDKYEYQAQENISREIELLQQGLSA